MGSASSTSSAYGLSLSKKGYIIANKKNIEKILALPIAAVRSEHFNGMVDGMTPVEQSIEEAKKTAREIIAAKRFGRGIAHYPENNVRADSRESFSIGDCCYDVTFYL